MNHKLTGCGFDAERTTLYQSRKIGSRTVAGEHIAPPVVKGFLERDCDSWARKLQEYLLKLMA